MASKETLFTFRYADWALASTLEVICTRLAVGQNVSWIDWTGKFQYRYEFPIADRLHNFKTKSRIAKSNLITFLSDIGNQLQFEWTNRVPKSLPPALGIEKLADEVAYLELIAILRESSPNKPDHRNILSDYKKTFLQTYAAVKAVLLIERPSRVFIYNGRFLQERAAWEACIDLAIPVVFYEKFNPNWADRYFLFEEPTHSPSYRSSVMTAFGENRSEGNPIEFLSTGSKWFQDRQLGKSQSYTKYQTLNSGFKVEKPFYVFFHSSEDELITTDLTSAIWGNQMSALSMLIQVMREIEEFDLVIRMHPNLLFKSPREIKIWEDFGKKVSREYPWVHYISAESPVNSYELIQKSAGVVTVGSTIGVEAAFLSKKSILLGRAFHEDMGITQNPQCTQDLIRLIKQDLDYSDLENVKHNSLKYAVFHASGGTKFKWVVLSTNSRRTFYFIKNFKIVRSFSVSILIRIGVWCRKIRNSV